MMPSSTRYPRAIDISTGFLTELLETPIVNTSSLYGNSVKISDKFRLSKTSKLEHFFNNPSSKSRISRVKLDGAMNDLTRYTEVQNQVACRNRSFDLVTTKPRCMLKVLMTESGQKIEMTGSSQSSLQSIKRKPPGQPLLKTQSSLRLDKYDLTQQPIIRSTTKNFKRLSKFASDEQHAKDGKTGDHLNVVLDDMILNFLKKTLSKVITESIYFKDYFKLFKKYKHDFDQAFRYRSKSESNLKCQLTKHKTLSKKFCLFTDYLHNIYARYKIMKDRDEKNVCGNDGKMIVREMRRPMLTKTQSLYKSSISSQRTVDFDFFNLNDYLKEFSLAIKNFNTLGTLKYDTKRNSMRMIRRNNIMPINVPPLSRMDSLNGDSILHSKPVVNIRSAVLFQKLVQHQVDADKKQEKKMFMKKTLNNCLNKSFFFIKRALKSRPKNKTRDIIESPSVSVINPTHIDIDKVYRIPKTFGSRQYENCLRAKSSLQPELNRITSVHSAHYDITGKSTAKMKLSKLVLH